jgi:hypothetical protein
VDGTYSALCPLVNFGISGVEPLGLQPDNQLSCMAQKIKNCNIRSCTITLKN